MNLNRGILYCAILFGTLFGSGQMAVASAPSCSALFINMDLGQAIESLAEMRIELDLVKFRGSGRTSTAAKLFEKQYPEKYQELLRYVGTEALLKKMLREKVITLQNKKDKKEHEDKSIREKQRQEIEALRLPFKKIEVPFPLNDSKQMSFEYLPDNHAALVQTPFFDGLSLIKFNENSVSTPLNRAQVYRPDSADLAILLHAESIATFNFSTGNLSTSIPLLGDYQTRNQLDSSINPEGSKIFISDRNQVVMIDVQSGQAEKKTWKSLGYHSAEPKATFINDREIFLLDRVQNQHVIYDYQTGTKTPVRSPTITLIGEVVRLPNKSLIYFVTSTFTKDKILAVLNPSDMTSIAEYTLPNEATYYRNSGLLEKEGEYYIFDFEAPERGWIPVPGMYDRYKGSSPSEIKNVTVKGDTVMIGFKKDTKNSQSYDPKGVRNYIELWKIN